MSEDKIWKQLSQYIDLYKFHWDLSLKLTIFIIGLSGAIAAYCIKNQGEPMMQFALVLPVIICCFGVWLAHRSLPGLHLMRNQVAKFAVDLDLNSHPEFRSLITFVGAIRFLFGATALGLVILFVVLKCHS